MAATKETVSFDEIIKAARLRRQKQALTDKFFGKERRSSAPGSASGSGSGSNPLASRVSAVPGSLASRAGIGKRSASAATKKPATKPAASTRPTRQNRMLTDILTSNGQASVRDQGPGFSIKGSAPGPCVVIGSNFAPGTTAADIESALEPVGGPMVSCKIVSTHPSVVAEMIFEERSGAEAVVARFNNQKADGRILNIRIEPNAQIPPHLTAPKAPRHMQQQPPPSPFDNSREQADRERREHRRADPQIQDGRYGFADGRQDLYDNNSASGGRDRRGAGRWGGSGSGRGQNEDKGLYSDQMIVDEPAGGARRRGGRGR
ncbi:hypothetical protein FQN50_002045 [Emmonsiellopsis sp. PD_5]|nr:hypothetical protein FQN50_002045 [Emmonsiellopsis sp. PD_5]